VNSGTTWQPITVRALRPGDFEAVVAIDAAGEGRARRTYIERRLVAAIKEPGLHVQLGAVQGDDELIGHILARRIEGEFGRSQPGLRLEIIGVRADQRERGVGTLLVDSLAGYARRHDIGELRTTATREQEPLLAWLAAAGFREAPNQVLDCAVGDGYQAERNDGLDLRGAATGGDEIDYGAPSGNDFDRVEGRGLACDVRPMWPADLPPILRIDREITGRHREPYIAAKLGEAMDDSAIRVSLTARLDGAIVGYLMARADLGDFGRTEPVAVLDTIGVDPAYANRGVGHALVSQLFANLGALQIDRVETVVSAAERPLLGFLHDTGFRRSKRLALLRVL
jgi:predicted N-acetyltransferase YhbS